MILNTRDWCWLANSQFAQYPISSFPLLINLLHSTGNCRRERNVQNPWEGGDAQTHPDVGSRVEPTRTRHCSPQTEAELNALGIR